MPIPQARARAAIPERSRPRPASGQRSQTSDSCSIAVNAAPATARVAGNVAGMPGPGLASNTPPTSGRSTTASPAMVSTTAAPTTSTVSISPVQGVVSCERAQDQQRRLGAAQAKGKREEDDRAEQQAADAEPGLCGQMLALQVRDRVALEVRRGGQQRPGWRRVPPPPSYPGGRA